MKEKYERFKEAFNNVEIAKKIKLGFKETKLLLICDKEYYLCNVKNFVEKYQINNSAIYSNSQTRMSFIFI